MRNTTFTCFRFMALCLTVSLTLIQSADQSRAAESATSAASAAVDLGAENRVLETYFNDLGQFGRKCAELEKKKTLTRADLSPVERNSDDLKRRLSSVQSALREVVRKLKAANQWDNLDTVILARVRNTKFQDFVRREGFKRLLEESASQLASEAGQVSLPLDALRKKVSVSTTGFNFRTGMSAFTFHALPTTNAPAPAMAKFSLKCRLTFVIVGVSGFIHGNPTDKALETIECACTNDNCFVW
jgi:hypothetical protein